MYLFSVVCFVFYFIINVYPLLLLITSTPVSIIFEAVYFSLVNLSWVLIILFLASLALLTAKINLLSPSVI